MLAFPLTQRLAGAHFDPVDDFMRGAVPQRTWLGKRQWDTSIESMYVLACLSIVAFVFSSEILDSANVRRMVVHTAVGSHISIGDHDNRLILCSQMLGNLKNPPEPFEDVIKTHFRLKARSITKQLDEWLALDDGKPTLGDGGGYSTAKTATAAGASNNGFQRDIEEMKKLLTNLQGEDASSAVGASGSGFGQLSD